MDRVILLDGQGREFLRPTAPAQDAGGQAWVDYLRALHAYNDAIATCANAAFDGEFRRALREGR